MLNQHRMLCLTALIVAWSSSVHGQSVPKKSPHAALAAPTPVASAGVRVTCEGRNVNARVTLNGVFKGECPLDATVPPGPIVLQATKQLDAVYEMVFDQRFDLGADVVRRVEVNLSELNLQFRAAAMARADAAIEADLARKEAQQAKLLPEIERSADGGDAAAMTRLGLIYERGLAGPVNFKKAITWYARAANAGDAAAMSAYGRYHESGWGVPKDGAQAATLYARAAAKGDPEGMFRMGLLQLRGRAGVEKNPRQAFALLKAAAERGYPAAHELQGSAQNEMGERTSAQWDEELRVKQTQANIKSAESGEDYDAMGIAGRAFGAGLHVAKDPELALKYARTVFRYAKKAAASGDARAINELGIAYQYGLNTPRDSVLAERLYRQAASLGLPQAESNLADLFKE